MLTLAQYHPTCKMRLLHENLVCTLTITQDRSPRLVDEIFFYLRGFVLDEGEVLEKAADDEGS